MTPVLKRYFDVVLSLTQKELRVRYKNYALGYVWSLAQPMVFAGVFYFAFKVALKVKMENYVFFLLSGLFPWQWLANSINTSPQLLLNNASIIKKVAFPRHAIMLSNVLQDAIHFLLALPVLAVVGLAYGKHPAWSWLAGIPLFLSLQMLAITGACMVLSSLNIFFRDLERLTILLTTLLFYFTPVVYSADQLPERFRPLLFLNPAAPLIVGWRKLFVDGVLDPSSLRWGTAHAVVLFVFGALVYRRLAPKFAEVL